MKYIFFLTTALSAFLIGVVVERPFAAKSPVYFAPVAEQKPQLAAPIESRSPDTQSVALPAYKLDLSYDPNFFNPRGVYYMIGRQPKGFEGFVCFGLGVEYNEYTKQFNGEGWLESRSKEIYDDQETYNDNVHLMVSGQVTSEVVMFTAVPTLLDEYEYRFEGRFLRSGVLVDESKPWRAVLTGKLSKWKQGVKIAECERKYRVEYLGC